MTDGLFVFARIKPKSAHLDDAREAIRSIMSATRAEPGCRRFELYAGEDYACLYLYEEWTDAAALTAHHQQPCTQEVFARYETWLSEPPEILRLRKID